MCAWKSKIKRKLFVRKLIITLHSALFLLLICLQNSSGQDSDIATNAASFLKIGAGARAIALGSAFVAVADDASAGYWNPAGLSQLNRPILSLADRLPVMDTNYAGISFATPLWNLGYLGLNVMYYSCGEISTYDSYGIKTGTLQDLETAMILSYAYRISDLSLGGNVKYIYQNMEDDISPDSTSVKSDGMGADISLFYEINKSVKVGAVLHNKFQVNSTEDGYETIPNESPLNIRSGIHYKAKLDKDSSFSLMMDLDQTRSQPLKLHTGTEFAIYDVLFIRAGLDDLYVETRKASQKDTAIPYWDFARQNLKPTFGLGLKLKTGRHGTATKIRESILIFDYALSLEKLGIRNFFTLAYQF